MGPLFRSFRGSDYAGFAALRSAAEPEYPVTPGEIRFHDEHRDPKCRHQRWVAEEDGRIVAAAEYWQEAELYHPRKFWLGLCVSPDRQGRGLGRAGFERLMAALAPLDPMLVHAGAREDRERAVRFLRDRGFTEAMREWESRLPVASFDPAPFAGVEERLREDGIEIRTLRELSSDPDRDRKLWELECAIQEDIPATDAHTDVPFEQFIRHTFENPNLLPDGWFVAVHKGEYVGCSYLWASQAGRYAEVGVTGVRREYRRRGIALALKVRTARYAREAGIPEILTWNATTNAGMLAINERLGFVRQPAWIDFVREFPGNPAALNP